MRINSAKRRKPGVKRLDTTDLRAIIKDGRMWTALGKVIKPSDAASHFEVIDGGRDILVEVETQPDQADITCRLGSAAGGVAMGLWRVPAVGDEVAVLVPSGQLDFMPMIVAVLSSGATPDRASDQRTILVATDEIEITAPVVKLGNDPENVDAVKDGFVHGQGIDPFTGSMYYQLGNTSAKVRGNK